MALISDFNYSNYMMSGERFDVSDKMLKVSLEDYYAMIETFDKAGEKKKEAYDKLKK